MTEHIAFSPDQQAAFLGHALNAPRVWGQLDAAGVTAAWCLPDIAETWTAADRYRREYGRTPGPEELIAYVTAADPASAVGRTVVECLTQATRHGLDVLSRRLTAWGEARIAKATFEAIQTQWRPDNIAAQQALGDALLDAGNQVAALRMSASEEVGRFVSAVERSQREEAARDYAAGRVMRFGIPYLDHALIGLRRDDLALFGGPTGGGKTQAAMIVAAHNAAAGRRVFSFQLEASTGEIEGRAKYRILARLWMRDNPLGLPPSYQAWVYRLPKAVAELDDAYRDEAQAIFEAEAGQWRTYYKGIGGCKMRDLRREILAVIRDGAELVVIDHFQYIDLEGRANDEIREATMMARELRQITLNYGCPILVLTHLNKAAKALLIPDEDGFYGSGNLSRESTMSVMFAGSRARLIGEPSGWGHPTFVRVTKGRVAFPRQTGVCFFSDFTGGYDDNYLLGYTAKNNMAWEPLKSGPPEQYPGYFPHSGKINA